MAKIMIMTVHIPMFFSLNDTDIISRQYPHRVWLNDWSEDGLVHFLAISFVYTLEPWQSFTKLDLFPARLPLFAFYRLHHRMQMRPSLSVQTHMPGMLHF